MKGKLLIVILVLFACITPVVGFEDDVERYETGISDKWDISIQNPPHGNAFVQTTNYPTEYPTSNAIYMYAKGEGRYRTYEDTGTATITSLTPVNVDYFAFTMYDGAVYGEPSATGHYENGEIWFKYVAEDGSVIDSYRILDDFDDLNDVTTRFEFVKSGTSMTIYKNGDVFITDNLGYSGLAYPQIYCYARGSHIGSRDAVAWCIIDDFSTSSILGIEEVIDASTEYVTTSHGIQYYDLFPDSTFQISVTDTSDLEVINTTFVTGYTGFTQWNRNDVFGENYGIYKLSLKKDDTELANKYFTYKSSLSLGTIAFDSDSYVLDETGSFSYTLDAPDFTNYDYDVTVLDLTGNDIETFSIDSTSGTESITFDRDNYVTGTYYLLFSRTSKSTGNEVLFAYDYASITDAIKFEGNTYLFNESIADNATVSFLQGSTYYNTTSNTNGEYTRSDLSTGIATTFSSEKTGFASVPYTYTPLASGSIPQDFVLFPDNMTDYWGVNNTSVFGLIQGTTYNPVPNAEVVISNATFNETTTANSVGFYSFHNLTNGSTYTITASASGQEPNTVNVTLDNNTRQDIQLEDKYNVTVKAKDLETNGPLATFTAFLGNKVKSTTEGEVVFTDVSYGAYTIGADADGYFSNSVGYVIDRDREITISLSQRTEQYYSPHYVSFTIKSFTGYTYENVNVNVIEKDDTDVLFSQATGADGSVGFQLDQNQQYKLELYSDEYDIDTTYTVTPIDTHYDIYVSLWGLPTREEDNVEFKLMQKEIDLDSGYINATWNDTSAGTTSVSMWINDTNDTNLFLLTDTNSTGNFSQEVDNNATYLVKFQLESTGLTDTFTRTGTITFNAGVNDAFDLGFSEQWHYSLLAALIITLIATFFGVANAHAGAFIVSISGWFMLHIGWLTTSPVTVAMLVLATLLSSGFYLRKGEAIR